MAINPIPTPEQAEREALLLPCPFCGSDSAKITLDHGAYEPGCTHCGTCIGLYSSHRSAARAWNLRPARAAEPAAEKAEGELPAFEVRYRIGDVWGEWRPVAGLEHMVNWANGTSSSNREVRVALALNRAPAEQGASLPFGQVVEYRNRQFQFYPRPELPYLDNASKCTTVYAAPPKKAAPGELRDKAHAALRRYRDGNHNSAHLAHVREAIDALAAAPAVVQGASDADIRRIFLANGFQIKPPSADLKHYVYAAARALLAEAAQQTGDALVSMSIRVARDGTIYSDVLTHDNSYADVSRGLSAVKREIERVFEEQRECPHYPANSKEANTPVVREAAQQAPEAKP